jgi:cell division protein YceG involved in septum cleavage
MIKFKNNLFKILLILVAAYICFLITFSFFSKTTKVVESDTIKKAVTITDKITDEDVTKQAQKKLDISTKED